MKNTSGTLIYVMSWHRPKKEPCCALPAAPTIIVACCSTMPARDPAEWVFWSNSSSKHAFNKHKLCQIGPAVASQSKSCCQIHNPDNLQSVVKKGILPSSCHSMWTAS